MRLYGYVRLSVTDQDLASQEHALRAAGCDAIVVEKRMASRREGRTELRTLLDFLSHSDALVVTRIDRLARSMRELQDIVYELKVKNIALKATEQPIDTTTDCGKAFFDMPCLFGEFEANLRRESQLEGIAIAKANGIYVGRKASIDPDEIKRLRREEKLTPMEIAARLGIGRASVYRILAAMGPI